MHFSVPVCMHLFILYLYHVLSSYLCTHCTKVQIHSKNTLVVQRSKHCVRISTQTDEPKCRGGADTDDGGKNTQGEEETGPEMKDKR